MLYEFKYKFYKVFYNFLYFDNFYIFEIINFQFELINYFLFSFLNVS